MLVLVDFTFDGVTGTAGSVSVGTAALNHEAGDNAVEAQAVVKSFFRQFDEVFYGVGRVCVEEFEVNRSLVGFHYGSGHGVIVLSQVICKLTYLNARTMWG